jgi:hypothetical protein
VSTNNPTEPPPADEDVEWGKQLPDDPAELKKVVVTLRRQKRKVGNEARNLRTENIRLRAKEAAKPPQEPPPPPAEDEEDGNGETVAEALALLLAERQVRQPRAVHEKLLEDTDFDENDALVIGGVPASEALDVLVPHLLPPKGGGGSGGGAPRPAHVAVPGAEPAIPGEIGSQAQYEKSRLTEGAITLQTRLQKGGGV